MGIIAPRLIGYLGGLGELRCPTKVRCDSREPCPNGTSPLCRPSEPASPLNVLAVGQSSSVDLILMLPRSLETSVGNELGDEAEQSDF